MPKLLVNADDFGLSAAINAGIVASHRNGIVTSTSVVASGLAFDEAVRLASLNPNLGVGVHLTLVEENSVSSDVSTLAPNGVLPASYGSLVKKVSLGQIRLRDVESEFRAQIEKCLLAGLRPTHLDSHQHTHALPTLFPVAIRMANAYNIPGIRIPRDVPALQDVSSPRFLPKCVLCLFAHADALLFHRGSCQSTDHFTSLFDGSALSEERLLKILDGLGSGTTELVAHPAYEDPSLRYANWNLRRQLELASLTSDAVKDTVRRLGIELISYRQL